MSAEARARQLGAAMDRLGAGERAVLEGKTLLLESRATGWGTDQFLFVQYAVTGPVAPCVLVDSQP